MRKMSPSHRNPSRETCESAIKRILMSEVLQNGKNRHFRTAADFMTYFESLYVASDSLTKQVQRAVKALNMPKDEEGFFIVNKTSAQIEQENEIRHILKSCEISVNPMEDVDTVFLSVEPHLKSYLIHLISDSETFRDKYVTIVETFNGLIFYTQNKSQLLILLNSLII